ncbi:MAG: hypothetical protein ABI898_02160 [Sphingomonadales bacterium]
MKMSGIVVAAIASALLIGCGKAPDSTNVADASNSAGAALENSAAELDATTDNLVENEIANINAASIASMPVEASGNNAVAK